MVKYRWLPHDSHSKSAIVKEYVSVEIPNEEGKVLDRGKPNFTFAIVRRLIGEPGAGLAPLDRCSLFLYSLLLSVKIFEPRTKPKVILTK